jgi:hypothetical protein
MVGYRALDNPGELHRGMPSSTLTFIVSLDDGVEAAESAEALPATVGAQRWAGIGGCGG